MDEGLTKALRRVALIRGVPSFLTFSRSLGTRIANGHSEEALWILGMIGAPKATAFEIVDHWPLRESDRALVEVEGVTLAEEAAVRLSFFIPEFHREPWAKILERAGRACAVRRRMDSGGAA